MEIKNLRYFLAVAREENMSHAAEIMHVTQPTLSKTLNIDIFLMSLLITSTIAALTIGGKSLGKTIALKNNTAIIKAFSKIMSVFVK